MSKLVWFQEKQREKNVETYDMVASVWSISYWNSIVYYQKEEWWTIVKMKELAWHL